MRADKALRAEWALLLRTVKGQRQQAQELNYSQQTWRTYREAWCRAAARDERGQSDWTQWYFGCLAELTRRRTSEIDNLIVGDGY